MPGQHIDRSADPASARGGCASRARRSSMARPAFAFHRGNERDLNLGRTFRALVDPIGFKPKCAGRSYRNERRNVLPQVESAGGLRLFERAELSKRSGPRDGLPRSVARWGLEQQLVTAVVPQHATFLRYWTSVPVEEAPVRNGIFVPSGRTPSCQHDERLVFLRLP